MTRRRIKPKPTDELETESLRLLAQSVRVLCEVPRGGSIERSWVITQAIEIAFPRDASFEKRLPARAAGPVVSALRATAQPPCPLTGRVPFIPAKARPAPLASSRNAPAFTTALSTTPGGPFVFPRR